VLFVVCASVIAWAQGDIAHPSLREAFEAAGFDAAANGNFVVVWAADPEYGAGEAENILPPIAREVNAMEPAPAFIGIIGNLTSHGSPGPGHVPSTEEADQALHDFRTLKKHLEAFTVPVKLILGAHDTHIREDKPELFLSVFPDRPEYEAFEHNGVAFFLLNGGNCGWLDSEQCAWFRREVARLHVPRKDMVIAVHQASMASSIEDRGIPGTMREVLSGRPGRSWLMAGQHHTNRDTRFAIGIHSLTQAAITSCNPACTKRGQPGYWICGFAEGRMVTRVFRGLESGYRVVANPDSGKALRVILPFEERDEVIWHVLVGENDDRYLESADATFCINYWRDVRCLGYRIPLRLGQGAASRVVVWETPDGTGLRKYALSTDGDLWTEPERIEHDGALTTLVIPPELLGEREISVCVENCRVAGIGLATTPGTTPVRAPKLRTIPRR